MARAGVAATPARVPFQSTGPEEHVSGSSDSTDVCRFVFSDEYSSSNGKILEEVASQNGVWTYQWFGLRANVTRINQCCLVVF